MALGKSFRKSTRLKVKASIMIEGLTGSGKSGLAIALARTLTPDWDKIFSIDTENMALDLFDGINLHTGEKIESFNKVDLTAEDGYTPSNYEALRKDAINAGAEVVIMDSYSHMWTREKGVLDLVSTVEQSSRSTNKFNAWNDPRVVKEKNLIFELVRSPLAHIITTVRSKEKFSLEFNSTSNKNEVVSLGEQQVQQEGLKYEPDLVLRMVSPGNTRGKAPVALVIKSRYVIFEAGVTYEFTPELLNQLKEYISEGADPEMLLKKQHEEYVKGIKDYCGDNNTKKSVWRNIKETAGYKENKIEDIPLEDLRLMFIQLTQE